MIKLVGVCLLISSTTLIGLSRSVRLACRERELSLIREILVTIKLRLEFDHPTTEELFVILCENERFKALLGGLCVHDLKNSLLNSEAYKSLSLTESEKRVLYDVFSQLGTTDLPTQLEMLSFNIMRVENALLQAQSDKKLKTRLYNSLGFLGGVLVSLLVI